MSGGSSEDASVPVPLADGSRLRIATRASRLALWQAEHVAGLIRATSPDCTVDIVHISTMGDRDQTEPLRNLGGWGVFTREVQKAVLDGRADLAVHSLKDLPTISAAGLALAAVPERADTADALVLPRSCTTAALSFSLMQLPPRAKIGTGSLRRQAQLLHWRPDFQLGEVRGNVETRLRKLDDGEYDALVLAVAGLERLGLGDRVHSRLERPWMFPAVGQGALGIECRAHDTAVLTALAKIDDPATRARVTAERALLAELRAGCHAPVGAASSLAGNVLSLEGLVLSVDGRRSISARASVSWNNDSESPETLAAALGSQVAKDLLELGADRLIATAATTAAESGTSSPP